MGDGGGVCFLSAGLSHFFACVLSVSAPQPTRLAGDIPLAKQVWAQAGGDIPLAKQVWAQANGDIPLAKQVWAQADGELRPDGPPTGSDPKGA